MTSERVRGLKGERVKGFPSHPLTPEAFGHRPLIALIVIGDRILPPAVVMRRSTFLAAAGSRGALHR
jgi:hypothetical protein